ncbi:sugar-binding protein [Staphylococcus saprophyticus]|uniref:sugar-binding protein n=1 Tax=Staphylococcus saprophyticus TaxID=29385 RepID=UPI0019817BB8|nr:sugar-binding protein [Staphylococcus saprophyticus]MBN6095418.1 sugar-binding protein [Staphylococcus saprophyticus]MBN6098016.1 sugar-binding protein [Staphylococcus saprophyticus]MBN6098888.1 sugar-binding protein [Staphylococcus saprophyticus]MDW3929236.1 sugar-binding protein [Staphylococcus saprophyticus]MDW4293972.1 sugar-binding protein [Staphylococcus saprophyticus]
MGKLRLNLQHFAEQTTVEPGETLLKNKHIGIIEKVTAKHSYSSPAIISNDAIFMEGRSFTVLKGDTSELKDYERNAQNEWDHPQIQETTYFLDQEKYWGRFVDALDKRDTEGNIDIDYVVAKQAAEVVAPYLDNLRFATLARNKAKHIALRTEEDAHYDAVLDVSVELDEINASQNRILFVVPKYYKSIKKYVVGLPQGDTQQKVLGKGIQGELDGFIVVKVPSKILQGVEAMAIVGEVMASPIQANLAKLNSNVPGMFGTLAEQLIYTGAFVPQHLQKFIYTIGGTEVKTNRDGIDAHATEVRTEDTGA